MAGISRRHSDRRVIRRGYSAGRKAYDRRRRRSPLDAEGRFYRGVVQRDPCSYCGRRGADIAADHVQPLSDGGANIWENLAAACRSCNASKGNRSVLEMMLGVPG